MIARHPYRLRNLFVVTVALTCALAAGRASAQRFDAYALADSVTIGERFEFVVSIEHDGSRRPVFPHEFLPDSIAGDRAFSLGGFTVLGNTPPAHRLVGSSWVIDSLRYEAATFELDSAYVPTMPVGLAGDVDTLIAGTPPLLVYVRSLVPEDAEGIRDITEIAMFPGASWWWFALPLILIASAVYWYWKRRSSLPTVLNAEQPVVPSEPAWDEALRRLRALERVDLSHSENVKPFYVELSDVLRTYLARRVDVPAMETTTRELVDRLQRALDKGMVPGEIVPEVEGVLSLADLVKFADLHPMSDDGRTALARTKGAIETTEHRVEAGERERAAREESENDFQALPRENSG